MNSRMTVMISVVGALALWSVHPAHAVARAAACPLLSDAEASAALGVQVAAVDMGSDAKHCHWEQQGKHGETLVDVHLLIESAQSYDKAKGLMGMSGKVTRVAAGGIGDDAYYLVGGRDAPLFVKKGNTAFRIAVDGKGWSADDIKAKEKALASAVLAKL